MVVWIVLGCAFMLISLSVVSYLMEKRYRTTPRDTQKTAPTPVLIEDKREVDELFLPQKAHEDCTPKYAVIDCQTTGLGTEEGSEDRIVEISWMILNQEFLEIERGSKRVLQLTAGTPEAKRIHHITEVALANTGEDEGEVLREFWQATSEVPIWVFHNAHFDLSILRGAFRDSFPEAMELMNKKVALCTMTYLIIDSSSEERFLSLLQMTKYLYHLPIDQISLPPIVSLRNVFLTRACLIKLLTEYPHLLKDNYPILVEQHLLTRN